MTSSETNSSYFNVQKSNGGENWEILSRLEAAGNSSLTLNYSYKDPIPFQGMNYYRLETVDVDGNAHYTDAIMINNNNNPVQGSNFSLFPNPSVGTAYVQPAPNSSCREIRLLNLSGQVL